MLTTDNSTNATKCLRKTAGQDMEGQMLSSMVKEYL